MAELKDSFARAGFRNVQTYIQSGNVVFESPNLDTQKLADQISETVQTDFKLPVAVAVFTAEEWQWIIKQAPAWWGKDPSWKHNLLILTAPVAVSDVLQAIGTLKPNIEAVEAGNGVVYQSMSFQAFGKTTTGKLASNPIYKNMTIRNYNTATKLALLLNQATNEV